MANDYSFMDTLEKCKVSYHKNVLEEIHMKKRVVAFFVGAAVAAMSIVPVMAGPTEEFAAAKAAQDQRAQDMAIYQANLESFYASQLANGAINEAVGQATANAGAAQLEAFQYGELAKGEFQKAEGASAYAAYQADLNAYYANVLAQKAAAEAERAQISAMVNEYLKGL